VRPGDIVLLSSSPHGAPLIRSLYRRVLAAGGHPHLRVRFDGEAEALLKNGRDDQLEWVNPASAEDVERADVRIAVEADVNTRSLSSVDPARQSLY
jgi:aminopeptidase